MQFTTVDVWMSLVCCVLLLQKLKIQLMHEITFNAISVFVAR
jgi:hypothetical protein